MFWNGPFKLHHNVKCSYFYPFAILFWGVIKLATSNDWKSGILHHKNLKMFVDLKTEKK